MNVTRASCGWRLLLLSMFGATPLAVLATGNIGNTQPPTPQEQTDFAAKRARIQAHMAQIPEGGGVMDVLASLTAPVNVHFKCPDGSPVNSVNINITTQHRRWDRTLAEKIVGHTGIVGAYLWNIAPPVIANGKKTYTAMNVIMLDPSVTTAQEQDMPLGRLADEALLYHELLHGQLLINAMRTDAAWQNNVCQCNAPDLAPSDPDHEMIHGLVDTYMQNVAGLDNTVHVVRPPAQPAEDADGNFEVDLGAEEALLGDKQSVSTRFYIPDTGNITESSLQVVFENGRVILRGRLTDPSHPGYVIVHIDPPTDWVFVGIETGLLILPASGIPAISQAGAVVAFALIIIAGTVLVTRRRRAA